jgi:hypothetical protein
MAGWRPQRLTLPELGKRWNTLEECCPASVPFLQLHHIHMAVNFQHGVSAVVVVD